MSEFTSIKLGETAYHCVAGKIMDFKVSRIDMCRTLNGDTLTYDGKPAKDCYGTKNECIDNEMFKLQQQRDMSR